MMNACAFSTKSRFSETNPSIQSQVRSGEALGRGSAYLLFQPAAQQLIGIFGLHKRLSLLPQVFDSSPRGLHCALWRDLTRMSDCCREPAEPRNNCELEITRVCARFAIKSSSRTGQHAAFGRTGATTQENMTTCGTCND